MFFFLLAILVNPTFSQPVHNLFQPARTFVLEPNGLENGLLPIDLDGDGTADLSFSYFRSPETGFSIAANPAENTEILTRQLTSHHTNAAIVATDQMVGAQAPANTQWKPGTSPVVLGNTWLENLVNRGHVFFGIRIKKGDDWLYGVVGLMATENGVAVSETHYESSPNQGFSFANSTRYQPSAAATTEIELEAGLKLTITTPGVLQFCNNTLAISLSTTPGHDVSVSLGSLEANNSPTLAFYENGQAVSSLTFPKGTANLQKTITFDAAKFYNPSNNWQHTLMVTANYEGQWKIQPISLPTLVGNNYQFTYSESQSRNVKDFTVFAGQHFERAFYFSNPLNTRFTGTIAYDEVFPRALRLNQVRLRVIGTGEVFEPVVVSEKLPKINPQDPTEPERFRHSVSFNNLDFTGGFEIVQAISAVSCRATGNIDVSSDFNIRHSCNGKERAMNLITNQPIQTAVDFRRVDPKFGFEFEDRDDFQGCLNCNERNFSLRFFNNSTNPADCVGVAYLTPFVFNGFNGNSERSPGLFNYTESGSLVISAVPVNSVSIEINPLFEDLLDLEADKDGTPDGIEFIRTVKGSRVKEFFQPNSTQCINDDEDYVELVIFRFKPNVPIPRTDWIFRIKYKSIELCPKRTANNFYQGAGLIIPRLNQDQVQGGLFNKISNGCGDLIIDDNQLWYPWGYPSYEFFYFNIPNILRKKEGVSEMFACSENRDQNECNINTLYTPQSPITDFTETIVVESNIVFSSGNNWVSTNKFGDAGDHFFIELETGNGLIPAPLNGNLNGDLSFKAPNFELKPANITVLTHEKGKKVLRYLFLLDEDTKQNPMFGITSDNPFNINLFFNKTNLYINLSALCSEVINSNSKATYKLSLSRNIVGPSCEVCEMPTAQFFGEMLLNCPGCVNPGLETNRFILERVRDNTSFVDVDDDGEPDLETDDNGLPNNGMALKRAVTGDVIKAETNTLFWGGSAITYGQLLNQNNGEDFLKNLYRVDNFGPDVGGGLDVLPSSLRLEIIRNGVTYGFGNVNNNIRYFKNEATGDYIIEVNRESIIQVANTLNGFPFANNAFRAGDVYRIYVQYRLNGDFGFSKNPHTRTIYGNQDFFKYEEFVRTSVFLSRDTKCQLNNCQDIYFEIADQKSLDVLISEDRLRYLCTANSASFTFYDYTYNIAQFDAGDHFDFKLNAPETNQACKKVPKIFVTSFTGRSSMRGYRNVPEKIFPYEYRPIRYPSDILIEIPNGYTFDGGLINSRTDRVSSRGYWWEHESQLLEEGYNYLLETINGKRFVRINPRFSIDIKTIRSFHNNGYVKEFMYPNDHVYMAVYPFFTPDIECEYPKYVAYKTYNEIEDQQVVNHLRNDPSLSYINRPDVTMQNTYVASQFSGNLESRSYPLFIKTFPVPIPNHVTPDFTGRIHYNWSINGLIEKSLLPFDLVALNSFVEQINNTIVVNFNTQQALENVLLLFNSSGIKVNSLTLNGQNTGFTTNSANVTLIENLPAGNHVLRFNVSLNTCDIGNLELLLGYNCRNNFEALTPANFYENVCEPLSRRVGVELADVVFNHTSTATTVVCEQNRNFFELQNSLSVSQASLNNIVFSVPKQQGMAYVPNSARVAFKGNNLNFNPQETSTHWVWDLKTMSSPIEQVLRNEELVLTTRFEIADAYLKQGLSISSELFSKSPCGDIKENQNTNLLTFDAGCVFFKDRIGDISTPKAQNDPCLMLNCDEPPHHFINTITWNRVAATDSSAILTYQLYYAKRFNGIYEKIHSSVDTFYVHEKEGSFIGCYYLTAVNNGTESKPGKKFCIENSCGCYELPNIITPNNDGKNDLLRPVKEPIMVSAVDFKLFNRMGSMVFRKSDDIYLNWNAEEVESGIYFYEAEVTFVALSPFARTIKGWLQIVK